MKKQRGPRGRNWKIDERKIIYSMVAKGSDLDSINNTLQNYQNAKGLSIRQVPQSSYDIMRGPYLPYIVDAVTRDDFARKPPPMGKLKNYK